MFSKSRINELSGKADDSPEKRPATANPPAPPASGVAAPSSKPKPPASVLSTDLVVTGNLKTTGDIQIEGTVKGDVHAHQLTVGEKATVTGEVAGDDVVITGRIQGRVRGLKIRLTSTARVEGDIIHKTLAIESGAQFEGSVMRQENPLTSSDGKRAPAPIAPQVQKQAAAPAARQQAPKTAAARQQT